MKPVGAVTRGTTNPNRLRRVDNWIAYRCADLLVRAPAPLVIDLGYGATPQEVMEVIELASPLGMAAVGMALPIVLEELAVADSEAAR